MEEGLKGFALPQQNTKEAAIVDGLEVYGIYNIKQVIDFLDKNEALEQTIIDTKAEFQKIFNFPEFDFSDVKRQENIDIVWKLQQQITQHHIYRLSRSSKDQTCETTLQGKLFV